MRLLVILAIVLAQPRRVNLHALPWTHVLDTMASAGADAARAELESVGVSSRPGWERAFALRWAGQLALREHRMPMAMRDFHAAMAAEPTGTDARWAALGTVDIGIETHDWVHAEQAVVPLLNDPDAGIRMYAAHRERQIRSHVRDPGMRTAAIVAMVAAWVLVFAVAWRTRLGWTRRFGRALLFTEALAMVSALAVHQYVTPLAQPGWMAGAVPSAVLIAAAIAGAPRSIPRKLALAAGIVLGCLGMVYTAFDVTWWSVH